MTDITIPTVALKAAARSMWRTDDPSQWELGMADIALRAGINAWPGMHEAKSDRLNCQIIILPLPKEKPDD
jgi:hypothetical protein